MTTLSDPRLKRAGKILLRSVLLLLCLLLMAGSYIVGLDPYDNLILENVQVGGLDLGGMTLPEAYRSLKEASEQLLEGTAFTLELPEETIPLSPAETGASLKCHAALLAAYQAGRTNQEYDVGLLPHLKLETNFLRSVLADYSLRHDTDHTPSRFQLTGTMPELEMEHQDGTAACQTLELTLGLPTARFDQEHGFQQILAAFDQAFLPEKTYGVSDFRVNILEEAQAPNLPAIYEEICIPPVDDSLDMKNYQVIPGAWGYEFDLDAAAALVAAGTDGETIAIPMTLREPEIHGNKVYFRDVLGHCETKHTQDENRNNNLRQACKSMDGLILQPGEVFSYNDTLGPRTKENGYLRAGAYSGWELVQAYGGGICQGSTTIYGAALYADLEIVHRRNHGYMVGYVEPGLDATVNWGGPDFQFRNSSHFPIKIAAEVSDGMVKVTILGTEERDYYIEMESQAQWGSSTIYAKSYKCKYDRQTGELLSRELEAKSNYMR